jgi:uncharacterized protein YqeY
MIHADNAGAFREGILEDLAADETGELADILADLLEDLLADDEVGELVDDEGSP